MRFCSPVTLPGGFTWSAQDVPLPVWQAHLLKHPLGVNALRRSRPDASWNTEAWDAVDPPVIDEERRARLVGRIVVLGDRKQQCEVRELRGRRSQNERIECEGCAPPLINQCAKLLEDELVGPRYASVAAEVVRAVADGVAVPRKRLTAALLPGLTRPEIWEGLAVMSVGRERALGLVRISRADGVRVELYIGDAGGLRWRTTYRKPDNSRLNDRWSFVLDAPPPDPRISLSEVYVVPRDWFIRHGS